MKCYRVRNSCSRSSTKTINNISQATVVVQIGAEEKGELEKQSGSGLSMKASETFGPGGPSAIVTDGSECNDISR